MSPALFDLTGRTALVTGSSRGLGRAIAEGLAGAGARVILHGADATRLESTVGELRAGGTEALHAAFDVTDEAAIAAAFERFDTERVEIDILVNNAGINLRKPMLEVAAEEWRQVVDTNLTSAFLVGREAARRMIPRGRGKIINIGSLVSERARSTVAPYAAAKGGIRMLTRAMAVEWGEAGIQINAIAPGYMLTDMTKAQAAEADFHAWVMARTPLGRWGAPEDLVGTAVYLASDAANYVTGQIIYVDGGMIAAL